MVEGRNLGAPSRNGLRTRSSARSPASAGQLFAYFGVETPFAETNLRPGERNAGTRAATQTGSRLVVDGRDGMSRVEDMLSVERAT